MRTWIMQRAMHWDRSDPALLDIIKAEVQAAQLAALPASALGKAVSYTLSLWHKLTRFLDHPELELSNNLGRIRCAVLPWDAGTGSMWAARRQGRRLRPFCLYLRAAGDCSCLFANTLLRFCLVWQTEYMPSAWAASRV